MAHHSRPRPPEWYAEQERLFRDAIRPLTALQVLVYSAYLPTIILDAEGKVISTAYPAEAKALIEKIDEEIKRIATEWAKP